MPRFLTIFPSAENVHLVKDVGMIPYVLHKEFNYDSTIACYKNGDYPYLDTEVLGLKQVFISKIFNNQTLDSLIFIIFNFRKYDILQCFHLIRPSLLTIFVFKLLKTISFEQSFTYLKMDADDSIKVFKMSRLYKALINKVDLVSVETKDLYRYLNENNILSKKVEYVSNGFYDDNKRKDIVFENKENLIITVGRIGTHQKNNEVLLEAFKEFASSNADWKLEIIGPIENDFQKYIQNYFEVNPNLITRVLFTGAITNRAALEDKYNKAKIFVLTSRYESFGLVYLEAMKSGCTILSTAITPAYDITDNERFGALFPIGNTAALVKLMEKAINNPVKLEEDCQLIQKFAYNNFSWKEICRNLDVLIMKK